MASWKTTATRLTLDCLYFSAAYRLLERAWSGMGVIFTLHHVRASAPPSRFAPNRILEISPAFLEQTIRQVREHGHDIISLDEACQRLIQGAGSNHTKFVCFTLDDGYADNYTVALPIFREYAVPFTVYVTTGLPDGHAVLWWQHLEDIIARESRVTVKLDGRELELATRSPRDKQRTFNSVYWTLRGLAHAAQCDAIDELLERYGVDGEAHCRREAMTWDMIRDLAADGLATIGAHTVNHYSLAKLSAEQAREEVAASRRTIAEYTGHEPRHFAYPFGDSGSAARREFDIVGELGFTSATTTRKGMLFSEHAKHLHALPRVSLNGDYQARRYVRLFLSGAPFALSQHFNRLDID